MIYYLLGFSPVQDSTTAAPVPPLLTQLRIEHRAASGIVTWYRAIERSEFEGADAQRNLADLNWLTPRVLAHESVVSKLSELFPLYPARFGCLFSSIDVLLQYAVMNQRTLLHFFDSAKDRAEWGIKFTTDLDQAVAIASAKEINEAGTKPSGANYLKLKQMQRTMRSPVLADLHRASDLRIEQLRDMFDHVVVRPNRSLAQPDRETLLANVALWLTPEEQLQVVALCDKWNNASATSSIAVATTGPWPAYTFCPSLGDAQAILKAA